MENEKRYFLNCSLKCGEKGKKMLEKVIPILLKKYGIDAWIEED